MVGILASPIITANDSEKTIFYDDFVPLCAIFGGRMSRSNDCLLYTSDAADE